jgi:hypothetical protein
MVGSSAMVQADTFQPTPPCADYIAVARERGTGRVKMPVGPFPVYAEYTNVFTLDEIAGTTPGSFLTDTDEATIVPWADNTSEVSQTTCTQIAAVMFVALITLVLSLLLFHFGPTHVAPSSPPVFGPLELVGPGWFDPSYWLGTTIEASTASTVTSFGLSTVGVASTIVLAGKYMQSTVVPAASRHCAGYTRSDLIKS